ncbi:hypothetical protein GUJ93_ZPchr0004g38467 [Zizania palustris]|uniref:Uncharacterized protein n=1 Tax=Zizania palustris TaxID=103762 RepID=A0A8J5V8Z2_ZIZPA|nr:hypothetical protein GUJ93_ZPchr0004g38467 [Zizania palustris]
MLLLKETACADAVKKCCQQKAKRKNRRAVAGLVLRAKELSKTVCVLQSAVLVKHRQMPLLRKNTGGKNLAPAEALAAAPATVEAGRQNCFQA